MPRTLRKTVRLHPVQRDFCESAAAYRAFIGGRGSGKSWVACYDLIRRAGRGRTYLLAAPTYPMLFDSEFRTFIRLARELCVLGETKVSPPHARLTTGAEVLFRSADDPDRLRGSNLSGAVLMEASLMPREVYDVVIACLRESTDPGWLSAAMTPRGPQHWTHEVFATGRPDTALFRAATGENPFLPDGFEEQIRRQYGDTQFARQELGGEFVSMEGSEWGPEVIDVPGRWFTDWPDDLVARVVALDPSKGAREDSDYQAFAVVGMDTRGTFYVDCEANREGVAGMVERGIGLCRRYQPDRFVVENNDGLGMLVTEFQRQLRERFVLVPVHPVRNTVNKVYRLRGSIGGYLCARHPDHGPQLRIRDTSGGRLLVGQMRDFPLGEFDDCLDALELALRALGEMFRGAR